MKTLLELYHSELENELREKIVGGLVLLKRKGLIDSPSLLNTLFPILLTTSNKNLRTLLYQKILSDLRMSNLKSTNHPLNRMVQNNLFNLLTSDRSSSKGIWAVKITRELWKRQIWTDAKAVEIMKEASLAENVKVIGGGIRFFLGGDKERDELQNESSDDNHEIDIGKLRHQSGINKKRRKTKKNLEEAMKKVKKQEKKRNAPHPLNFSAFHFLHDPQSFAETLFFKHLQNSKSKLILEQKLLVLQLVTRLVGLHKLSILPLYSYFSKYLTPRQPSVTSFLASLAQATHSLVPPDELEPLIQKIANEFVSEASSSEVASAGLNAIREICVRQPLAMKSTLLQDLVMYRKSKDKGTMMAAKGLLSLYRDVGANLLRKRDRGKYATMEIKAGKIQEHRFGEEQTGCIEGIELLEEWKNEERKRKQIEKGFKTGEEDFDSDSESTSTRDWELQSNGSDNSGGWINVESYENQICEEEEREEVDEYEDEEEEEEEENVDGDEEEDLEKEPVAKKIKLPKSATGENQNIESTAKYNTNVSNLATTRILTPADLAKLHELRLSASLRSTLNHSKTSKLETTRVRSLVERHADDAITAESIEGLSNLRKSTKEEMVALAKEGKSQRDEHKSTQALRRQKKVSEGKSSTNKEKARMKNFMMTLGKAKSKQKRSLVQTRKILKCHIERSKRGGRRGNIGK